MKNKRLEIKIKLHTKIGEKMKLKKSLILICVLSLVLSGIPANKAKAFTSSDIIVENGDLLHKSP